MRAVFRFYFPSPDFLGATQLARVHPCAFPAPSFTRMKFKREAEKGVAGADKMRPVFHSPILTPADGEYGHARRRREMYRRGPYAAGLCSTVYSPVTGAPASSRRNPSSSSRTSSPKATADSRMCRSWCV